MCLVRVSNKSKILAFQSLQTVPCSVAVMLLPPNQCVAVMELIISPLVMLVVPPEMKQR